MIESSRYDADRAQRAGRGEIERIALRSAEFNAIDNALRRCL
ncbi:hypothetical protein [Nonomuraea sp. GTA35]